MISGCHYGKVDHCARPTWKDINSLRIIHSRSICQSRGVNNFIAEEGAAFFVVGVYLNKDVISSATMIFKKRISEKIVKERGLELMKTLNQHFQANKSQQIFHCNATMQDHCLDIGSSYC